MADCPEVDSLVESLINRVLTQYRESPKLLHLMRTDLRSIEEIIRILCGLPDYFDLDTAVGEQLTFLGKRMGFPRCHCVCEVQPVFGFECDGFNPLQPLAGFCDPNSTWADCDEFTVSDLCINDDELYRKFLYVRRYQMLALFDLKSLEETLKIFWGDAARVLDSTNGKVTVTPGRALTIGEMQFIKLYLRVLPISPGIKTLVHFGEREIFGFGTGWGGFCETQNGVEQNLIDDDDRDFITNTGDQIITTPFSVAEWMCGIDIQPYDC